MKTKHLALALAAALACPTLVHAQQAEGARATATDDTPESDARRVETPDPQLPTVTVVGVRVIPLPRADAVRADAALAAGAKGPEVGRRIHEARVQAVAEALALAADR